MMKMETQIHKLHLMPKNLALMLVVVVVVVDMVMKKKMIITICN